MVVTDGHVPPFDRGDWMSGKMTCVSIGDEQDVTSYLNEKFDEVFSMKDEDLNVDGVRKVMKNVNR